MDKMKKLLSSPKARRKADSPYISGGVSGTTPSYNSGTTYGGSNTPLSGTGDRTTVPSRNLCFGVPLAQICQREGTRVPLLVTKCCHYISLHGLHQEGIFRVSGSARVIDQLRVAFDTYGDANLDDLAIGDVMAVAGLLKRFLRELPQALIPENMTDQYIQVVKDYSHDASEVLHQLKLLTHSLEPVRYHLLKYLCHFLCVVCKHEQHNKMNAKAIAIVFGPNLFSFTDEKRVPIGYEGLQQQGTTNQIVAYFITKYNDIFLEEGEQSPFDHNVKIAHVVKRAAPPRPAPPKLLDTHNTPVPSPRKSKGEGTISATQRSHGGASSAAGMGGSRSQDIDEEYLDTYRSDASHQLESDFSEVNGGGSINSSLSYSHNVGLSEAVKKSFSTVVSHVLFGDSDASVDNDDEPVPVPAPRRKKHSLTATQTDTTDGDGDASTTNDYKSGSVKQRISMFTNDEPSTSSSASNITGTQSLDRTSSDTTSSHGKLHRQRPRSEAFEMFEKKGIIISPAAHLGKLKHSSSAEPEVILDMSECNDDKSVDKPGANVAMESLVRSNTSVSQGNGRTQHSSKPAVMEKPTVKPRSPKKQAPPPPSQPTLSAQPMKAFTSSSQRPEDVGFDLDSVNKGSVETLSSFKRPAGPKNRRSPSRRPRSISIDTTDYTSTFSPTDLHRPHGSSSMTSSLPITINLGEEGEELRGESSTDFLDLHHIPAATTGALSAGSSSAGTSPPARSPLEKKPFVPPLDLSTLHEHCEGAEPIVSEKAPLLPLSIDVDDENEAGRLKPAGDGVVGAGGGGLCSVNVACTDQAVISPRQNHHLKKQHQHVLHDTDVPPSPPTEHATHIKSGKDDSSAEIRSLTKKIQACKRKIRAFEEDFESQNGYRPSQADKAAKPEIKKSIQELARARKELRRVKEQRDSAQLVPVGGGGGIGGVGVRRGTVGGGASHIMPAATLEREESGEEGDVKTATSGGIEGMRETLQSLEEKLTMKRNDAGRPEDLSVMTRDEVHAEKIAVQKALLSFENVHGRPVGRQEKDLMKPLYDRYRSIKRMLAKPPSPRDVDLATVPEEHAIEFSPTSSAKSSNRDIIRIPTVTSPHEEDLATTDFTVTRDFGLMSNTHGTSPPIGASLGSRAIAAGGSRSAANTATNEHAGDSSNDAAYEPIESPDTTALTDGLYSGKTAVHELTLQELLGEQQSVKGDKKRLRKLLKDFEDNFFLTNGRKVSKTDRSPMETEYNQYKEAKAKLKLLDALLSKHYNR